MESTEVMKIVLLVWKPPITFFLHVARLEGMSVFLQDGQMMSKKKKLYAS